MQWYIVVLVVNVQVVALQVKGFHPFHQIFSWFTSFHIYSIYISSSGMWRHGAAWVISVSLHQWSCQEVSANTCWNWWEEGLCLCIFSGTSRILKQDTVRPVQHKLHRSGSLDVLCLLELLCKVQTRLLLPGALQTHNINQRLMSCQGSRVGLNVRHVGIKRTEPYGTSSKILFEIALNWQPTLIYVAHSKSRYGLHTFSRECIHLHFTFFS